MFGNRRKWNWIILAALLSVSVSGCTKKKVEVANPTTVYLDARTVLMQAAEGPDPLVRANAIEAMSQTLGSEAGPIYKQALSDSFPVVRFAAAMAIGDTKYEPALEKLQKMGSNPFKDPNAEGDRRVFCAVIYAMHRLGDTRMTGELGRLLSDPEKDVRANAAIVLGRIGEPSARIPLQQQFIEEQDPTVRIQIVEAEAVLGDIKKSIMIEAYTKTQFLEDRMVAISALSRIKSERAPQVLMGLMDKNQPLRVRVAAAGVLAELGYTDEDKYNLCLEALKNPVEQLRKSLDGGTPSDVEIQSLKILSAIALGWMGRAEAEPYIRPMLKSNNGSERVAAAMSLLRLFKAYKPSEPQPLKEEPVSEPETLPQPVSQVQEQPTPELFTSGGKD